MLCVQFSWKWPSGSGSRKFKISTMYFCDYLPLERGVPLTCKTWISFTQRCVVPSLVEVGRVILEKIKIWKLYRRTDRRRAIRKALLSFQLRWAKSSQCISTIGQQSLVKFGPYSFVQLLHWCWYMQDFCLVEIFKSFIHISDSENTFIQRIDLIW